MTAPLPRWAPVVLLLVTNLVPLWLVLDGTADTADLLMAYVLETWVLLVLALPQAPRIFRWIVHEDDGVRAGCGMVVVLVMVVVGTVSATRRVVGEVSWDVGSVLGILGVALGLVFSLAVTWWRHGSPVPGRVGAAGAFAWRFVLLVSGAVVGLGAASAYDDLLAHGWEPAALGDGWAYPVGQWLIEASIELDVPSAVMPAVFLVAVRTVNEVFHEVFLVVTDSKSDGPEAPEPEG